MSEPPIKGRWYWDRRIQKAVYCQRASEGTVEFRSVWHSEEAADALETGALAPFDSVGLDRTETTFDLIESFRTAEVDAEQPTTEPRMAERED